MKKLTVSAKWLLPIAAFGISTITIVASAFGNKETKPARVVAKCCVNPAANHVCVMKTILGIDTSEDGKKVSTFVTSPMVNSAVKKGIEWVTNAQSPDGGWGSGGHDAQNVRDPHAVKTDPASTSLVAMSLLRTDNTPEKGKYADALRKGTEYLLKAVENCPADQLQITSLTNTQPQVKLGRNIDVILTAQFFTNLLRYDLNDEQLKSRVERALDICIGKIQKTQSNNGAWQDGGWAPVLQSALANNALESADDVGRKVDSTTLKRSRDYQSKNFNADTKSAVTGDAAGVMLYSITSTARASAKDAQMAEVVITKAKKEGKLSKDAKVSEENLAASGLSPSESKNLATGYKINKAAQTEAMKDEVMSGFGNNGGEEFLSFLMTGESMLMQGGDSWKNWYDMMSGKLVNIQNKDGSWNGHHCITSPVFCTATCLLILSIHNDMQFSIQAIKK
ncbi:MAG TPA: prenyltransferase/squalene oxidase repeat-containing protein [Chitinophagaceae bacterium]|nr:prenyltransferase/squalene oxidase repeat-containing protein [Chitinophagaceae bacterium]